METSLSITCALDSEGDSGVKLLNFIEHSSPAKHVVDTLIYETILHVGNRKWEFSSLSENFEDELLTELQN